MPPPFHPLVSFADGPIGYSWKFLDTARLTNQAGTWPILSCVTSCSGAPPLLDGQGMTDAIDEYCPPGVHRASFSFGTGSGTYTSISMGIREAADLAATSTAYNAAATPNSDTLTASAPVLGSSWTATLTRGASGPPGALLVLVRAQRLAAANGLQGPAPLPVGAGGRILIGGAALDTLSAPHDGLHGSVSALLPLSFDLLCVHFAAQAIVLGGGVRLSSAVEGTIGTF